MQCWTCHEDLEKLREENVHLMGNKIGSFKMECVGIKQGISLFRFPSLPLATHLKKSPLTGISKMLTLGYVVTAMLLLLNIVSAVPHRRHRLLTHYGQSRN